MPRAAQRIEGGGARPAGGAAQHATQQVAAIILHSRTGPKLASSLLPGVARHPGQAIRPRRPARWECGALRTRLCSGEHAPVAHCGAAPRMAALWREAGYYLLGRGE